MASQNKWIRIHREFEWPDAYNFKMKEDLRCFFDRYLKNIYNGWELTPKLRLWAEAAGHDDMDLFVTVQKLDKDGNFIPTWVFGERHPGAWGKMRASRRHQDPDLATDIQPVQSLDRTEKLAPGEIVPLDIEIYPYSRIWHKGEKLRVRVAGRYIRDPWFEPFSWDTDNHGKHVIHTGATYDSYLQIPVIPPKYQAGDYVYR